MCPKHLTKNISIHHKGTQGHSSVNNISYFSTIMASRRLFQNLKIVRKIVWECIFRQSEPCGLRHFPTRHNERSLFCFICSSKGLSFTSLIVFDLVSFTVLVHSEKTVSFQHPSFEHPFSRLLQEGWKLSHDRIYFFKAVIFPELNKTVGFPQTFLIGPKKFSFNIILD